MFPSPFLIDPLTLTLTLSHRGKRTTLVNGIAYEYALAGDTLWTPLSK